MSEYDANGCQVWLGSRKRRGSKYGRFAINRKMVSAHRLAYILFKGEIPPGHQVDHTCRNRACVAPEHLECVSHCCPYHAINDAVDAFCQHHGGVASIDLIDALMVVMSEIIAAQDDAEDRKTFVSVRNTLPKMAREFRAEGRYPGGSAASIVTH
jgi:hypothetical protein